MIFNWFNWQQGDKRYPKIHPTQKADIGFSRANPNFTGQGDVVMNPCAEGGSTLRACAEIGRYGYGFEVSKQIYKRAKEEMLMKRRRQMQKINSRHRYKSILDNLYPNTTKEGAPRPVWQIWHIQR